jgi:hypothetical protein
MHFTLSTTKKNEAEFYNALKQIEDKLNVFLIERKKKMIEVETSVICVPPTFRFANTIDKALSFKKQTLFVKLNRRRTIFRVPVPYFYRLK